MIAAVAITAALSLTQKATDYERRRLASLHMKDERLSCRAVGRHKFRCTGKCRLGIFTVEETDEQGNTTTTSPVSVIRWVDDIYLHNGYFFFKNVSLTF